MSECNENIWLYTIFSNRSGINSEADQYDANVQLDYFTVDLPGSEECVSFCIGGKGRDGCPTTPFPDEATLLSSLWAGLTPLVVGRHICGWKIYEQMWPRLINRSLHHGIPIPVWASNDISKRYTTVSLLDPANIYRQGIYQGIRPLPALQDVIRLWMDVIPPSEETLRLWVKDDPLDLCVHEATCVYLEALKVVTARYMNQQAPHAGRLDAYIEKEKEDDIPF